LARCWRCFGGRPVARLIRQERGAALIEAALVLPIMLLIAVGIFEFGRAYQVLEVLTNAAREGARVAVLPYTTDADAEARVRQFLQVGGLDSDDTVNIGFTATTVSMGAAGNASATRVTVTYPFSFMVFQPVARLVVSGSSIPGDVFNLTVASTMRDE
jgi:Flp pilus assembly protein TadG